MVNTETGWGKLSLGIGTLAVFSGIYFIFQNNYVDGICGSILGIGLIFLNMKKIKDNKDE